MSGFALPLIQWYHQTCSQVSNINNAAMPFHPSHYWQISSPLNTQWMLNKGSNLLVQFTGPNNFLKTCKRQYQGFYMGQHNLILKTQIRQAEMPGVPDQTCFKCAYSSISTLHSWIQRLFLVFTYFKISKRIKLIPTIKWSFCLWSTVTLFTCLHLVLVLHSLFF